MDENEEGLIENPEEQEGSALSEKSEQSNLNVNNMKQVGKLASKKLKNGSLLKAAGPILIKIGIIILFFLLIIGIAMFLVSMPGMVMEKLKGLAREIGNSISSFFGGDTTDDITDQQIYDVLDYLEEMGFDLKGDGFLTDYVGSADDGVERNEDGKIANAESDFITTYLISDNYVYTIANFNSVTTNPDDDYGGITGVFRRIGDGLEALWAKTSNLINHDGYKWGRGLIELYYDNGIGVEGDYFGSNIKDAFFKWSGVKVNANEDPPTLEIRRGWFSNTMKYSLDGWTGRYGMPLDFLIAVHQSTLMPDLAYEMVKTFDTKITILLHDVKGTAIGAYKTDSGQYVSYEEMQEAAPTFEVGGTAQRIHIGPWDTFSDEEAKKLMRLLGLKSPDDCINGQEEVGNSTFDSNGNTGDAYLAVNTFNEMVQSINDNGGDIIQKIDDYPDLKPYCTSNTSIEIPEEGFYIQNSGTASYAIRSISEAKEGIIDRTWTNSDDGRVYRVIANVSYIEGLMYNSIGDATTEINNYVEDNSEMSKDEALNSYFQINGNNMIIAYVDYKIVKTFSEEEIEANGGHSPKCSEVDDETTICEVCKKMVFNTLKETSKVDVAEYETYQPYISKVTNHWYRDVYFFDTDKEFVAYDYDYESVMKERWTKYETKKDGTYQLYKINDDGKLGAKYKGTQEDADKEGIAVAKKAEHIESYSDLGWENIGSEDSPKWSAYGIADGKTSSDFEQVTGKDGKATNIYAKTVFNGNIVQKGNGLRTETNPYIKNMFLNNEYFSYKGDTQTAEIITALRKKISTDYDDVKYYGPIKGKKRDGDNLVTVDHSDITATIPGSNQEYSARDYISKVSLEQDFLTACNMLENTHTLDADYILRDFKELSVELGYFGKEELTNEMPRLLEFPIPDIGSFGYPKRLIDKNENEYGSMIHSYGDIGYEENLIFGKLVEALGSEVGSASASSNTSSSSSSSSSSSNSSSSNTQFEASDGSRKIEQVSLDEFLDTTRAMCEYINKEGYDYCVLGQGVGGESCHHDTHNNGCNLCNSFVESQQSVGNHNMCCATLVSWALQNVKVMADDAHQNAANALAEWIKANLDCTVIRNGEELKEGDILCYNNHIDIVGKKIDDGFEKYNGGGRTDVGAQEYGANSSIEKISGWPSNAEYALRLPWGNSKGKGEEYRGYAGNEAVVSPVTGILLEYGTYDTEKDTITNEEYRVNTDYKYDTTGRVQAEVGNIENEEDDNQSTDNQTSQNDENREAPVDKVGYAKILVLDYETYEQLEDCFSGSVSSLINLNKDTYNKTSLSNENGTFNDFLTEEDQMKADEDNSYPGWTDKQKTIYGYKEFVEKYEKYGIAGNIVYIDGFICEEPESSNSDSSTDSSSASTSGKGKGNYIPEGNKPIEISNFKAITSDSFDGRGNLNSDAEPMSSSYEKDDEYNMDSISATNKLNAESLVEDEAVSTFYTGNQVKVKIRSNNTVNNSSDNSQPIITEKSYDGIFIKEGTVLGRTMTDMELTDKIRNGEYGKYEDIRGTDNDQIIGNYLRIIMRNTSGEIVENVEDYMKLDDGLEDVDKQNDHFSIVWTVLSEDEWVEKAWAYVQKTGATAEFCASKETLKELYNICKEFPVNPEYVFVKAIAECSLQANGEHNYWGYGTPNGAGLAAYSSWQECLKKFCKTTVDYQDPAGTYYSTIMERYNQRKACTSPREIDPLGYGEPTSLSGVLSVYTWLGDDHSATTAGGGGMYYLYPWRYAGPGYEGENKIIFESKSEFESLCGSVHSTAGGNPSSVATTVWEQGMYTAWGAKKIVDQAKDIFGELAGTHDP